MEQSTPLHRPNGLLLAATQQEVQTLPPRRLVERKQAREDSGRTSVAANFVVGFVL